MAAVLTDQQREEFDRTGLLRLEGAFSRSAAEDMRVVLWNELVHRYGIERDDPTTWDRHPPTGLKSTKRAKVFQPICSPVVGDALDDLLGPGCWDRPEQYGNVLVTMPNATQWRVPHRIWHSDFEATNSSVDLFAVKLWALFGAVEPGGGGTPQLLGSHKLFARYLESTDVREYKRAKLGFLRSHPSLIALTNDDGDPRRNERFMGADWDVDGLPARVVELTGAPGDVFITHGWLFHTVAVNATDQPRLMRSVAVRRR